jgi:hypothetical protein
LVFNGLRRFRMALATAASKALNAAVRIASKHLHQ